MITCISLRYTVMGTCFDQFSKPARAQLGESLETFLDSTVCARQAELYETPTKRPHSIYPRRSSFSLRANRLLPPFHRFAGNFVDAPSMWGTCG